NLLRTSLQQIAANPTHLPELEEEGKLLDSLARGEVGTVSTAATTLSTDELAVIADRSATLRVNFAKLDELLNLVGELVMHRTSLDTLERRLRAKRVERELLADFKETNQFIADSASRLREAIMKVRMLPIRLVFERFRRLVRDLSQSHQKEVRLRFEGEETEIDKTVIDEIGEPLLHLIRNAIDHGMESPEERRLLGKPAAGTLLLRASHENSQIIIQVTDDGCGMEPERLRQSAVKKGILTEEQARALTDQEALQIIFMAGFSTRSVVTETSGRGIGLDVVKKRVISLNGMLEIDSRLGEGTTFTIKLPLTLAIITALMVEVRGRTFAIPITTVQESVKVPVEEIHRVEDGEVLQLRDRIIPVFRLSSFFGLDGEDDQELAYVVIVGSNDRMGGIVVDRLRGQQEVVIKPMDDYLGDLPGISGGSVLGDGSIALILDIAAFIGRKVRGGVYGKG
ncbi:MAG TPA: chemotaxis protein CheA, partial [Geobacterales bacterium]|nr:chemotaxis protein CheA [Geobacterales bacterium]